MSPTADFNAVAAAYSEEGRQTSNEMSKKESSKTEASTAVGSSSSSAGSCDLENNSPKEAAESSVAADFKADEFIDVAAAVDGAVRTDGLIFVGLLFTVQVAVLIACLSVGFTYDEHLPSIRYGYFRDVNIMIFCGFGFLMTFLRRYGLSAIGYTLIISAMVVELSIVWEYVFFAKDDNIKDKITIETLFNGLFCSGAVMISFGAVLGKTTPAQLVLMAIIESALFFLNAKLAFEVFEVHDCGGGIIIHTFGAYFGLAVCWSFSWSVPKKEHQDNSSIYSSDVTSLIGTLFLWCLWPSFNAAVVPSEHGQVMAVANTFISLCSSTIAFAMVSRLLNSERKFDTVQLQNATLAGGVAMGVSGDLNIGLFGAILGGFGAGAVSCVGYEKLTPLIEKFTGIQDICGVHNLHGMPGLISVVVSVIAAQTLDYEGASVQKQVVTLLVTLGIALISGLVTGQLMHLMGKASNSGLQMMEKGGLDSVFNDRAFWVSAGDYDLTA